MEVDRLLCEQLRSIEFRLVSISSGLSKNCGEILMPFVLLRLPTFTRIGGPQGNIAIETIPYFRGYVKIHGQIGCCRLIPDLLVVKIAVHSILVSILGKYLEEIFLPVRTHSVTLRSILTTQKNLKIQDIRLITT